VRETRILIIDDEPAIGRALRPALHGHGFTVVTAVTAADGLAQVEAFGPDLILLDLGLPDMDGQRLLGEIRRVTAVPVIVLSVRGAERDKIAALDNGADDYLTKPFGIGELLARMMNTFRISAAEIEALDNPRWGVLGVACVSNSAPHANEVLSKVVDFIEAHVAEGYLADYQLEFVHLF
jgi:two-component system KDP operon response regulator KdpE